jgi:hypothetical protein
MINNKFECIYYGWIFTVDNIRNHRTLNQYTEVVYLIHADISHYRCYLIRPIRHILLQPINLCLISNKIRQIANILCSLQLIPGNHDHLNLRLLQPFNGFGHPILQLILNGTHPRQSNIGLILQNKIVVFLSVGVFVLFAKGSRALGHLKGVVLLL